MTRRTVFGLLFAAAPLQALVRKRAQNNVPILLYHQVSPELFSSHLKYLSSSFQLVSLNELRQAINKTVDLPTNSLVVTFDDGWRSNYDLLPVIRHYACPVTIFLPMGLVGTNRRIWNTSLSHRDNFRLQKLPNAHRLKELQAGFGYSPEKEFPDRTLLNFDELQEMSGHVDFQSHGMYHPVLPNCSEEELGYELRESKRILEDRFEQEVFAFAYPHGLAGPREAALARKAGYRLARMSGHFAGAASLSRDPLLLPAVGVRQNMSVEALREEILWGEIRALLGRTHRMRIP